MTDDRKSQIETVLVAAGPVTQIVVALCIGLWFVFGSRTTADQSALSLRDFRQEVAAQFADVKSQIASLPDQRAAAVQLERRIAESADRNSKQDDRISKTEQDVYQLKADVTGLLRTSGIPATTPTVRR